MGIDIHIVIEASTRADFGEPIGVALFDPPRQTELFLTMAGLRGRPCPVPPRTFPDTCSELALHNFAQYIVDDVEAANNFHGACITREEAQSDIEEGLSYRLPHSPDFISSPGFSHASWLTLAEFRQVLLLLDMPEPKLSLDFECIVQTMACIEEQGLYGRMVFWFDE